jgi:Uma2 family endonuclease
MTGRMTQTRQWTYDDYASLPDDGNHYEVIDGVVCMTPAAGTRHQYVAGKLHAALMEYVEQHRLGIVFYDVDLLFVSGQYLRPDIVFIPNDRMAGVVERGIESKPGLVVEVLSPSSHRYDRVLKPRRYRDFGVEAYWVVDPEDEIVEQYLLDQPPDTATIVSDVLRWQPEPSVPALELPLNLVFKGLELHG